LIEENAMQTETVPLFDAIKKGDQRTIENILKENPELAGARDPGGLSTVLAAVYYGQPAIAQLLIEMGAPLNLFEACAVGRIDIVREIVQAASSTINSWAPDGFQPLGLACFFGYTELVSFLLERGAEVNSPSHNLLNVQPINSAVAGQHLEITRMLLEHGADANARQGEGFTPLHGAAQNGQIEMIQLLLDFGADPLATNITGKTAADVAQEAGHQGAFRMLQVE